MMREERILCCQAGSWIQAGDLVDGAEPHGDQLGALQLGL